MKKAVILSGARTPIGCFLGSLQDLPAPVLGSRAIEGAIKKAKLDPKDIDEVVLGQVLQGGAGQAPARQASLGAGLLSKIPCTTINKVCGSGLKAVMLAADAISLGHAKFVLAGGMESMSNAPYILPNARQGFRMGHQKVLDLMLHDGLFDPYGQSAMGGFGDICAKEYKVSRESQDEFASKSYEKAISAQNQGYFDNEIIPIKIKHKNGEDIVNKDEEPSRYKPEKMPRLYPAFNADGTITAANASKINDGAAALVLADEEEAQKRRLAIKARIIGSATYAHEPQWFTTAPIGAIKKVMEQCSLKTSDIGLYEINEAFSVVPMIAIRELGLNAQAVNIFGGAVALGHPIGCSGARILVTLLNAMEIKGVRFGCAALCLGGGEAVAMVVEKVN